MEEEEINVTHVDSQLNFYFRYNSVSFKEICKKEHRRIDNEIRKIVGAKTSCDPCIPTVDAIVGFLHFKWLRWVRARVQEKQSSGNYLLFLIDHGYEMLNSDVSRFIELPEVMKHKSIAVLRGSLDLRPCERVRDHKTTEMIITPVRYYEAEAIGILRKLNESTFQCSGKVYFELKEKLSDESLVGELKVRTMQETYSVSERLIEKGFAMRRNQNEVSREDPPPLPKQNVVPLANFEKIIQEVCPNIPKKSGRKEIKVPYELPAPVSFKKSTGQIEVPSQVTAQTSLTPPKVETALKPTLPQQMKVLKPKFPSVSPPSDIVVFSERLLPSMQSISHTQFGKVIGEHLKNNLKAMSKVQAHCWPQVAEGRSMVIIGSNRSDMTSPYLPPLIDALQRNKNEGSSPGIGPIAIIVTKSSSVVKEIAQLSSRYAEKLVVVDVYGENNKVEDLINGCDLLVATAPAFSRMVDGIHFQLFDKSRIKHVVFDYADELLKLFQSEINEIARKCTHGRMKTESNPQIIITAKHFVKDIEPKLMSLIHKNNLVICFEDFVDAAAYVKCLDGVGMKFLASTEEKISKLLKMLQTDSYKSLRTLVVTNDDKISKMLVEKLSKIKISLADDVNCKSVKSLWTREQKENFSVLVTTDTALKQMELRNVQNLIHFSIPKSWESFSRRFGSMIDQFYKQLVNKDVKVAQTTIFLDDENNLEFTQLVKFLKARSIKVTEVALHAAKLIGHQEELFKIQENVAICNDVLIFGECKKKQKCFFRHTFADSDKSNEIVPSNSFIKFDVVSTKTPTSYMIKIKSRLSGTNWITWDEKNCEIEKVLKEDLQDYFSDESNILKPSEISVGEVYALKRDGKWLRCRIIEKKSSGLAEISLIDVGKNIHFVIAKLVKIPDRLKSLEPLCQNLQILNLVPFDHEYLYDDESKRIAGEIVDKVAKECTFMCKVQLTIRDIMFTDSFDAKDDETGSLKLRLRTKLLKKSICAIDETVDKKLRALLLGQEPEEKIQVEKPSIFKSLSEPLKEVPESAIKESWKVLSWDSYYDVHVKHFKNPESFLVVLDLKDSKLQQSGIQEISKTSVTTPLDEFKAGIVCAVQTEITRRGKIVEVKEDQVIVLLVDYGEIILCNKSELFVLPKHLITKIPFQTIHCSLIGVRPKYRMNIWPGKQIQAIQTLLKEHKTPLKMIVKKKNLREKDDLMSIGMNSYNVTLANSFGDDLSEVAVEKKFVDEDKVSKPKAKKEEEKETTADEFDLLQRMLEKMYYNESSDEESDEEEFQDASDENASFQPEPVELDESPALLQLPTIKANTLSYIHKHPKIEWRQNEEIIYLLVSAIDCKEYGVQITDTSMKIGIKYIDGFHEQTSLQLYSVIDVAQVSHELRGLNIIVRLFKKNPRIEWPRLTAGNEKSQFIKYSTAKIAVENPQFSPEIKHDFHDALPDGFVDDSDCEDLYSSDNDDDVK